MPNYKIRHKDSDQQDIPLPANMQHPKKMQELQDQIYKQKYKTINKFSDKIFELWGKIKNMTQNWLKIASSTNQFQQIFLRVRYLQPEYQQELIAKELIIKDCISVFKIYKKEKSKYLRKQQAIRQEIIDCRQKISQASLSDFLSQQDKYNRRLRFKTLKIVQSLQAQAKMCEEEIIDRTDKLLEQQSSYFMCTVYPNVEVYNRLQQTLLKYEELSSNNEHAIEQRSSKQEQVDSYTQQNPQVLSRLPKQSSQTSSQDTQENSSSLQTRN